MNSTLKTIDVFHKTVIVRVDFNVPLIKGVIQDDTRIKAAIPTILYLQEKNAKIILMSHLGKVKTEEDLKSKTLNPVAKYLSQLLTQEVIFCPTIEGQAMEKCVDELQEQQILLIENTRFADVTNHDGTINLKSKRESECNLELSKYWGMLGEVFVNDAFATCHRRHASNVGIAENISVSCLGFLVEKELTMLNQLLDGKRKPYVTILGGAKISDKIKVLDHLLKTADHIIIGGGMSYTFLKAQKHEIGTSLFEKDSLIYAEQALKKYKAKIHLPLDYAITKKFENNKGAVIYCDANSIPKNMMGMDIGPKTSEAFSKIINTAHALFWNGPVGVFEFSKYATGTNNLLKVIKDLKENRINQKDQELFSVIGGGDTASAAIQLGYTDEDFSFISTGGGATLNLISNEPLPGIEVILQAHAYKKPNK